MPTGPLGYVFKGQSPKAVPFVYAVDRGTGYEGERNDCTVRALSNALLLPYRDCYRFLREQGRKTCRGVRFTVIVTANPVILGHRLVEAFSRWGENNGKRITVNTFLKRFPEGHYIVRVRAHVFAVIDGVVYDHTSNQGRFITHAWKVEEQ